MSAVGPSAFKGEPQAPQNLNFGEFSASHFGQRLTSGNPHCPQKRIPSGFSLLHLMQRIWMQIFVRFVYASLPSLFRLELNSRGPSDWVVS